MEFKANVPIYLQVIDDIKKQIVTGDLALGDKLPSTRELAVRYQINPNTAVRVYNEMELEGLTFTKRGLGTFVTEDVGKYESIKKESEEIAHKLADRSEEIIKTLAQMSGVEVDEEVKEESVKSEEVKEEPTKEVAEEVTETEKKEKNTKQNDKENS